MINKTRYKKTQKGTTTVEASIVGLVLFMVIFLILEGSVLIFNYNTVAHGAREGARFAAVRGSEAGIDKRRTADSPTTDQQIKDYIQSKTSASDLVITINWELDGNNVPDLSSGKFVEVEVTKDFIPITPFLPTITLNSKSTSVIYY
ncbi:pilus assembly protein [Photobacterium makurazakiensis]|uniref:TadE/TadG family type IV pilus assembly protein n=1 Tax=Photobacterium makurazakiensis TaxID=2910234 RepID=UPI003D0A6284